MAIRTFITVSKRRAANVRNNVPVMVVTEIGQGKGIPKKKQKVKRILRYVEDLDSIYVDEQNKVDKDAKQKNIILNKGVFKFDDENDVLLRFLEAHPDNVANGGNQFKELIVENEELYELEKFKKINKAKDTLANADDNLIRAMGLEFIKQQSLHLTVTKIALKLIPLIEENKVEDGVEFIERFMSFSKTNTVDQKVALAIALKEGILEIYNGKSVRWAIDSKETVYSGTQSGSVLDEMAIWLTIDKEGQNVLSSIAKEISKLKK